MTKINLYSYTFKEINYSNVVSVFFVCSFLAFCLKLLFTIFNFIVTERKYLEHFWMIYKTESLLAEY